MQQRIVNVPPAHQKIPGVGGVKGLIMVQGAITQSPEVGDQGKYAKHQVSNLLDRERSKAGSIQGWREIACGHRTSSAAPA